MDRTSTRSPEMESYCWESQDCIRVVEGEEEEEEEEKKK